MLMSTAGFGAMTNANAAIVAVPAPPAVSEAVAVKVGDIASVGETGAASGQNGSVASAAPITIAGQPVLGGTKGTTASGSDSLLDTGETQLGRVAVLPWSTDVRSGQSSSSAAVATAKINNVGSVAVAPSSSFASWTPGQSNASAISDGAILQLGDYTIKVLHSQSNSSGKGRTYLVQIFGSDIGMTDANGCLLDLGPVAAVGCLNALSGVGAEAAVADVLMGKTPFGKVVSAGASGGSGRTLNTDVLGADTSRGPVAQLLARTGQNALMIIAVGLLMIAGGMTAIYGSRKPAMVPTTPR